MFTLTFTEASGRRESHPLADGERGLVVGRDESCDVVLQSKEVSRRHARFYVRAGDLVVEDLQSHNGVFVAGKRIEKPTPLVEGPGLVDIEVGDVKVSFGATALPSQRTRASLPAEASAATRASPGLQRSPAAPRKSDRRRRLELPETAASALGSAEGVGAGAVLRGLGKDAAAEIQLPPRATVGRDAACDVVLDDDSVSRKHAELFRDDRGQYRIKDLDSANGTFIDGEKVSAATLLPDGARIRFGDVELLFWRPPPTSSPASQRLLLGGMAVILLLFAALFFVRRQPAKAVAQEPAESDQAGALSERAQAAIESDRFDEAARLAQQALEADPLAPAPRRLLATARREQQSEKLYTQAQAAAQVGREDEALQELTQIPTDSRFFPRARIRAKELGLSLLRSHTSLCKSAAAADRTEQVALDCARALDLKCQLGDVDQDPLLKSLRAAEKKLQRKVPWSCPRDLAVLFRDELQEGAPGGLDEGPLKALYPDPVIEAALAKYARGDTAEGLRMLQAAQKVARSAEQARSLAERIRLVEGRYREGQTALLSNDLARADLFWQEALQADAQLLPAGTESFTARQLRNTLAQEHGKAGDERFARTQYASAYDQWTLGLAFSPKDPHLLDALGRLEKTAEGLLGSGDCDKIAVAAHITRADPPSAVHASAQKALERCK